jgi:MoxR-like ATPase
MNHLDDLFQTPQQKNQKLKTLHQYSEMSRGVVRQGSKRLKPILVLNDVKFPDYETPAAGLLYYVFPRPEHYQYPSSQDAYAASKRVIKAIRAKRSVFLYGDAGCGKSALVRAIGSDLVCECAHYAMRESLDPEMFIGRTVIKTGDQGSYTEFEKGPLLRDLEGRVGKDGVRRPVLILIDDIDRAPAEYHEILRHVLEDNARNVFVPEINTSIHVFEGTVIVATANSHGKGDMTSLYASARTMDESILDRFGCVVKYPFLSVEEEVHVLKQRFPEIPKNVLTMLVKAGSGIRVACSTGVIHGTFSHRRLVVWCTSLVQELKDNEGQPTDGMIMSTAADWLDWYDLETQQVLMTTIRAHVADFAREWKI